MLPPDEYTELCQDIEHCHSGVMGRLQAHVERLINGCFEAGKLKLEGEAKRKFDNNKFFHRLIISIGNGRPSAWRAQAFQRIVSHMPDVQKTPSR
jgi:hypothetical protein